MHQARYEITLLKVTLKHTRPAIAVQTDGELHVYEHEKQRHSVVHGPSKCLLNVYINNKSRRPSVFARSVEIEDSTPEYEYYLDVSQGAPADLASPHISKHRLVFYKNQFYLLLDSAAISQPEIGDTDLVAFIESYLQLQHDSEKPFRIPIKPSKMYLFNP